MDAAASTTPASVHGEAPSLRKTYNRVRAIARSNLYMARDLLAPLLKARWGFTGGLFLLYLLRLWFVGGYYIVSYALGIYLLNLVVIFLMPQLELEEEGEEGLPVRADDEFRPFIRKLPEFRFWRNVTTGLAVAFVCTFIGFFDLPVFWPILLLYFIILTVIQLKSRIKHMIKHRYIPFNLGKPRYPGKTQATAGPAMSK